MEKDLQSYGGETAKTALYPMFSDGCKNFCKIFRLVVK